MNCLPTPVLNFKSPFHVLFNKAPNYLHLKVFGCLCYLWFRPNITSKLQVRSTVCIFIGYSTSRSAYKCFDPISKNTHISRHVKFIEHIFSMQATSRHLITSPQVTQSFSVYPNAVVTSLSTSSTHTNTTIESTPYHVPLSSTHIIQTNPTSPISETTCTHLLNSLTSPSSINYTPTTIILVVVSQLIYRIVHGHYSKPNNLCI